MQNKSIHILLVEDNEGDVLLIKEAFEEVKSELKISTVSDGQAAIDFLCNIQLSKDTSPVNMVLLDVNLPKLNGHEVLQQIKENDALKSIPVIMLTTSSSPNDINKAYNNQASSYIVKPTDINQFLKVVAGIENYWLNTVMLPVKTGQIK